MAECHCIEENDPYLADVASAICPKHGDPHETMETLLEWQESSGRHATEIERLREALENLCGDVYLFSGGEVTLENLLRTQGEGLAVLRGTQNRSSAILGQTGQEE